MGRGYLGDLSSPYLEREGEGENVREGERVSERVCM
jgi:hypothetical protein